MHDVPSGCQYIQVSLGISILHLHLFIDTPRSVHPSYGNGLQNTLPARDTDLDAPDSHDYQRQDCHYYQNVRYTERDYRGGNHTTQYGDNTDPARTHPIPAPRRTSQVLQAGAQGTNTVQQANGENMDAHISHIQTQPNWIGPGQPHPPFLAAQHLPPHNPTGTYMCYVP